MVGEQLWEREAGAGQGGLERVPHLPLAFLLFLRAIAEAEYEFWRVGDERIGARWRLRPAARLTRPAGHNLSQRIGAQDYANLRRRQRSASKHHLVLSLPELHRLDDIVHQRLGPLRERTMMDEEDVS